jgi:hypothetical protein
MVTLAGPRIPVSTPFNFGLELTIDYESCRQANSFYPRIQINPPSFVVRHETSEDFILCVEITLCPACRWIYRLVSRQLLERKIQTAILIPLFLTTSSHKQHRHYGYRPCG